MNILSYRTVSPEEEEAYLNDLLSSLDDIAPQYHYFLDQFNDWRRAKESIEAAIQEILEKRGKKSVKQGDKRYRLCWTEEQIRPPRPYIKVEEEK